MDRTVLLDNEVGTASDIAGAPPRRLLSIAQPVLLWSTAVAMLAIAWAPEATRASPDPVRLAADAQQTMALRIANSAAAAEDGNSEATPRDEGGTKRPALIAQGGRDQSGPPPSDQEPDLGGSLSCELTTARLDIGLLQRIEHERERAETLEQGLAAARRDLEVQTALANKAVEDAARVKQAVQGGAGVQDALQQALERAGRLEQDLVAARHDVETQTALAAQAGEEVLRLKRAGEIGTAETRQPARVGVLAGGFSLTRSAIQAYEAQAGAVGGELAELGQDAASDTGSLRYPEKFARLEQDLVVARGELETQTTIATKASEEAFRLRQSGERDAADLQQEREQSARLERDLAAARRDLETQTALAVQAGEEASRLKAAGESGTPDLKREEERSAQLEQDLAATRRDLAAQTALAAKAGEEVSRQKLSAEAVVVDLKQSRAKADALAQELSQARSSIYAYEAQALKAGEEVAELRRAAEGGTASAQKASPAELGQLARLEQDLAAARSEVEAQAALAAKASDETARLKRERENGAAESQNLLQAARQRADRLEQDLVAARRDAESKTALVTKAGDETTRLQVVVKSAAVDLQKERERSARLEQDLAAVRRDVESRTALVTQASEQTSRLQAASKSAAADLQKERERSARLEQDLAAARRDSEVQTARAAKANEDVLLQKKVTEAEAAELKQLRAESAGVRAQNVFLSRSAIHAYEAQAHKGLAAVSDALTTGSTGSDKSGSIGVAANPILEQAPLAPARAVVQPASEHVAEAAGLVARASSLLRQGDVGAARLVLERAVEMGSAQASFALAETYDPLVLAKWGTYGTRSDASKAKALYAKADAAGIKEAKARLDALHR
ncbi:hypothetical protein HAP47_0026705 [Bradyrhizobium sp. 41S5]|uniref:hypothetical protein n=1 Tax=Bradyrhizobium sp. 41S5 TaxID=1404443 RepID=UPI00156A7957|nr:hypothetical protein [Bradyrhizobium sp. 41S5]UFX42804.1 hypothetical protein HAP47_0026705 [Bradyrhizobium sp. 41S5]